MMTSSTVNSLLAPTFDQPSNNSNNLRVTTSTVNLLQNSDTGIQITATDANMNSFSRSKEASTSTSAPLQSSSSPTDSSTRQPLTGSMLSAPFFITNSRSSIFTSTSLKNVTITVFTKFLPCVCFFLFMVMACTAWHQFIHEYGHAAVCLANGGKVNISLGSGSCRNPIEGPDSENLPYVTITTTSAFWTSSLVQGSRACCQASKYVHGLIWTGGLFGVIFTFLMYVALLILSMISMPKLFTVATPWLDDCLEKIWKGDGRADPHLRIPFESPTSPSSLLTPSPIAERNQESKLKTILVDARSRLELIWKLVRFAFKSTIVYEKLILQLNLDRWWRSTLALLAGVLQADLLNELWYFLTPARNLFFAYLGGGDGVRFWIYYLGGDSSSYSSWGDGLWILVFICHAFNVYRAGKVVKVLYREGNVATFSSNRGLSSRQASRQVGLE